MKIWKPAASPARSASPFYPRKPLEPHPAPIAKAKVEAIAEAKTKAVSQAISPPPSRKPAQKTKQPAANKAVNVFNAYKAARTVKTPRKKHISEGEVLDSRYDELSELDI